MINLNNIQLVGRLVAAPEMRYTGSGAAVLNVTLAVNRDYVPEGAQKADFIPVVVFDKLAETLHQYGDKGVGIYVEGRLQSRSYETQDGQRRVVCEVIAEKIRFAESKTDREAREARAQSRSQITEEADTLPPPPVSAPSAPSNGRPQMTQAARRQQEMNERVAERYDPNVDPFDTTPQYLAPRPTPSGVSRR
jgi:single-strand DNA-binding protein